METLSKLHRKTAGTCACVIFLMLGQFTVFGYVHAASNNGQDGRGWFSRNDSVSATKDKSEMQGEFMHQNDNRSYILYTPELYDPDKSAALVVALHGAHGNARNTIERTDFNDIADREGFLVLYPEGISRNWNDGRSTNTSKADDVGFINSLIDLIAKQRNINHKRIYVTGLSNGGIMTQRLACESPDRFAAFAAVIANLPLELEAACNSSHPVPIMIINGKDDGLMPWAGGEIRKGRFLGKGGGGAILSAEKTAQFWAGKNQCNNKPESIKLPDIDPGDGTRIEKISYAQCKNSSEVILYAVDGGGHTWPGSKIKPATRLSGKVSQDMNASEVIWKFFSQHLSR